MTYPDLSRWPTDRPDIADLADWASSVLPGGPAVDGPTDVLQVKSWGVTALFTADGQNIVVKHVAPVLYPQAAAVHHAVQSACPSATAELLAHTDDPAWQRSIFAFVSGPTVEKAGADALIVQARTLGELQGRMAETELAGLPQYDVAAIPDTLLADLSETGDVESDLVAELSQQLPALHTAIAELTESVPLSIDHPDVQGTNGILRDDSSVVLLDWEEARVGNPLFSLDRLLQEGEEMGNPTEVVDAYLDALPWSNGRHLAELALQLAPLKLAIEAREYARVLGLPHPHTRYTTRLLNRAFSRLSKL